jgi:hypothetical protein
MITMKVSAIDHRINNKMPARLSKIPAPPELNRPSPTISETKT